MRNWLINIMFPGSNQISTNFQWKIEKYLKVTFEGGLTSPKMSEIELFRRLLVYEVQ